MKSTPILPGIAAAALLVLIPNAAVAAESYEACDGFIDALPATITTQGIWCLNKDLATAITSGYGIFINANNVTIDCNGHKVGGLAGGLLTTAKGIYTGRPNTRVRNCHVRGFETGLNGEAERAVFEDNIVEGATRTGIRTVGDGNRVWRNRILDIGGGSGQNAAIGTPTGSLDVRDNLIDGVYSPDSFAVGLNISADLVMTNNIVRDIVHGSSGSALGLMQHNGQAVVENNTFEVGGATVHIHCTTEDTVIRNNAFFGGNTSLTLCDDDGGNIFK